MVSDVWAKREGPQPPDELHIKTSRLRLDVVKARPLMKRKKRKKDIVGSKGALGAETERELDTEIAGPTQNGIEQRASQVEIDAKEKKERNERKTSKRKCG